MPCVQPNCLLAGARAPAATVELVSLRDPRANQPSQGLHWTTWELPVPPVDQPRPFSRRTLSCRGRAATAPPPPLADNLAGCTKHIN
jgi:hypothetical protein